MEQETNSLTNCVSDLGYPPHFIQQIRDELNQLFEEIDFNGIKQRAIQAAQLKDTDGFIKSIKDLMFLLEGKGIYRPDAPVYLIKLLVNGLNLKHEDMFDVIARSRISFDEKLKEMEFLASCAAITQLGYILLKCIVPEVIAAGSGEHVFLVIDGFLPDSKIFVDFSIDSIIEINTGIYICRENTWALNKNQDFKGLDVKTIEYLTEYYSCFQLTSGIGLNHNIHNNLGLAYDRIGMFEDAIQELHEALRLNPDYYEVHNNLGVTFHKIRRTEEAEQELKEAIRLNPEYVEARCNLANIYVSTRRVDEALFEVHTALMIDPDHAPAHNNLGDIYAFNKQNPQAINEYRHALRIDPNYIISYNNLGHLFMESGMYDEAMKEFQHALDIDPVFPEANYGLGLIYYERRSYEKALQAFIKAVYYSPDLLNFIPDNLILKVRQAVNLDWTSTVV